MSGLTSKVVIYVIHFKNESFLKKGLHFGAGAAQLENSWKLVDLILRQPYSEMPKALCDATFLLYYALN